jgi:hypothetical protein
MKTGLGAEKIIADEQKLTLLECVREVAILDSFAAPTGRLEGLSVSQQVWSIGAVTVRSDKDYVSASKRSREQ